MTVPDIAAVLREHWTMSTHTEATPHEDRCDGCGAVLATWGRSEDPVAALRAHQAERVMAALTEAGWGVLAHAWTEGAEAEAKERDGDEEGYVFTFTCSMANPYLAWDELPDQPGTFTSRPAARQEEA